MREAVRVHVVAVSCQSCCQQLLLAARTLLGVVAAFLFRRRLVRSLSRYPRRAVAVVSPSTVLRKRKRKGGHE